MYHSNHANQGGRIGGPPISLTSLCNCLLSPVIVDCNDSLPGLPVGVVGIGPAGASPLGFVGNNLSKFLTLFQSVETSVGIHILPQVFFTLETLSFSELKTVLSVHCTLAAISPSIAQYGVPPISQHGAPNSAVQHRTLQYTPFALLCVLLNLFTLCEIQQVKFFFPSLYHWFNKQSKYFVRTTPSPTVWVA